MCFPYAVVQFLQEGNYSEIPSSWLTKDCTQCRWPPVKNVTFLLKNRSPPQVDWLVFDVTVECYCETLEKARKKAEDANYTTSCDEMKGRGKRVIYKKVIHAHDSCDDSADDDSDVPPQINKTTQKKLKIDKGRDSSVIKPSCSNEDSNEKQSSCEYVSRLVAEESLSPPNRSLCDKLRTRKIDLVQEAKFNDINEPVASGSKEVNVQNVDVITAVTEIATVGDVEKQIKISVEILKYVKSIDKRLKTLERGVNAEEPVHMFDNILPIDSMQDLKQFEETIETAEIRENLVELLKKVGGKGNKNVIQRCMNRLFTNKFGISCSWCGRRKNFRMCDLKCMRILKGVLRAKGVDESDFETVASEWFRLSKLRYERENKALAENRDPLEIERPPAATIM